MVGTSCHMRWKGNRLTLKHFFDRKMINNSSQMAINIQMSTALFSDPNNKNIAMPMLRDTNWVMNENVKYRNNWQDKNNSSNEPMNPIENQNTWNILCF